MRDAGHRTPDAGHRTSDGEKSKNNISTPQGGGHNDKVPDLKEMFPNEIHLAIVSGECENSVKI